MQILITHTGSAHRCRWKIAACGLIVGTSMMALSTTASASDRDDTTLGASGVKAQVGVVYSRGGGGRGTGGRHR